MIKTKNDLIRYLEKDRIALGKKYKKPKIFGDEIWKFEILLRKLEYVNNANIFLKKIRLLLIKYFFHKLSIKLGFSIPINVFDEGLSIAHYGTIVVNSNCRIGKNCRIQENVTIGSTNGSDKAPIIGDNVFIGSGAKLIGNIKIQSNCNIGAGAVVVKSFNEEGITIAGVPAIKISNNSSKFNLNELLFEERE